MYRAQYDETSMIINARKVKSSTWVGNQRAWDVMTGYLAKGREKEIISLWNATHDAALITGNDQLIRY